MLIPTKASLLLKRKRISVVKLKTFCCYIIIISCAVIALQFVSFGRVYKSLPDDITEVTENELLWNEYKEQPKYPIDVVITWAGDNYDQNSNRNRDNGELKYCLRSIYQNIPWFNHIYIVTNPKMKQMIMQNESFMNVDKIKLEENRVFIISHNDIFNNKEYVKECQNSAAIESSLHRIQNLSDHFIYFNDDHFIGQALSHSFFFMYDENKYKDRLIPRFPYFKYIQHLEAGFVDTLPCLNSNHKKYLGLIDSDIPFNNHGSMSKYVPEHIPTAYYKLDWMKFEKQYPDFFNFIESKKNRFTNCQGNFVELSKIIYRKWIGDDGDIEMNKMYFRNYDFWYTLAIKYIDKSFTRRSYYNDFIYNIKNIWWFKSRLSQIESNKPLTFCINDDYSKEDLTKYQQAFRELMDKYFPKKSLIEK